MSITITPQDMGSNIVNNPVVVKQIRVNNGSSSATSEEHQSERSDSSSNEKLSESSVQMTDAEKRAKRREEFRDASAIRERALKMQRQAEERIKQTEQFTSIIEKAKEDPTILAKALGMDESEFQRKLFNKVYSIEEDKQEQVEESFEEQTKKRLAMYEEERAQEKQRREEEARQNSERNAQQIKHKYISDNILPLINDSHEFIHRNDKHSCAALAYDLMNQAYQEHCNQGGDESNFELNAKDVIDQLEEELYKNAEEQIANAKNISKLRKHFRDDDSRNSYREERRVSEDGSLNRKSFNQKASVTLSNSLGTSVPRVSMSSSRPEDSSERRISIKNREARLNRLKKVLGS